MDGVLIANIALNSYRPPYYRGYSLREGEVMWEHAKDRTYLARES
jgi:hypothetical protein